MKHFLSLSLALAMMSAGSAVAGPVSRSQALETARDFYFSRLGTGGIAKAPLDVDFTIAFDSNADLSNASVRKAAAAEDAPTYYVVNVGVDKGYVVVAGDDEVEAVLGYASDGHVGTEAMPPSMLAWLDFYDGEIKGLRRSADNGLAAVGCTDPADGYTYVIRPMLGDIKWNQDDPYNGQCPTRDGQRTMVGCIATAIGQIMYYYRYPQQPEGTVSYRAGKLGLNISVDFSEVTFDYDKMLPNYDVTPGTAEQQYEVAKLLYHAGVAARMDYGVDESGANVFDLAKGLTENFGFSTSLQFVNRNSKSLAEWHSAIQGELSAGRPVFYTGSGDGGHAFVCDGYDGAGMYHFNWGWGGISDGYFRLTSLNPMQQGIGGNSIGYDYLQTIFVGLQPKGDDEPEPRTELSIFYNNSLNPSSMPGLTIDKTETGRTESATVTFGIYNSGPYNFNGTLAALLVDSVGDVAQVVCMTTVPTVRPSYMRPDNVLISNIGENVPDGVYRLKMAYRQRQYPADDWHVMDAWYCNAPAELVVEVTSDAVRYSIPGNAQLQASVVEAPSQACKGRASQFKVRFRNNGNTYYSFMGVSLQNADGSVQQNDLRTVGFARNGDEVEVTLNGVITVDPGLYSVYPLYDANGDMDNPSFMCITDAPAVQMTVGSVATPPDLELMPFDDGTDAIDIVSCEGVTSRFGVNVRNNGEYFSGKLRLGLDGQVMTNYAYGFAEIAAGETLAVELSGELMLAPGTYEGRLYCQDGDTFIPVEGGCTVNVNMSTGVDGVPCAGDVRVYPSPAHDHVTVEAGSQIERIELYGADGALLRVTGCGESVAVVVLDGLDGGVYLARIITADGIMVRRILKR